MLALLLFLTCVLCSAQIIRAQMMPTPQTLKFFESENCTGIAGQISEFSLFDLNVTAPENANSVQVYGFWRFLSTSSKEKTYRISYNWECFPTAGLEGKYNLFIPFGDKYMNQEALYLYSEADFDGEVRIIQNDEVDIKDGWAVKSGMFVGSSEWSMYKDIRFQDFYECWQPKYNHPNYINGIGFTLLPIHPGDEIRIKSVHKKCLKPEVFEMKSSSADTKATFTLFEIMCSLAAFHRTLWLHNN